jgi:uncharacterized membrane protein YraQ (UPF0718 family)
MTRPVERPGIRERRTNVRFWRSEWKGVAWIVGGFLLLYHMPMDSTRFQGAVLESLQLAKWYAREHMLLCLVPAFFIAGAIAVFVRQESVTRYLGAGASKLISYAVASVSGTVLAVCSCTVLPLFAGIYRRGAGIGPATAFLYSGPAINVLAVILTARVLGMQLGIARAVGAVAFSVVIGLLMHALFKNSESDDAAAPMVDVAGARPVWQDAAFVAAMVGILVFANWGAPAGNNGVWHAVYHAKWQVTAALAAALGVMLITWFRVRWWGVALASLPAVALALAVPERPSWSFAAGVIGLSIVASRDEGDTGEWFESSWGFARQITPLLFGGVLVAGLLLGRPGEDGLIPAAWVSGAVGGNSVGANLFASVVGAFMYFATLTEVPILQGLIGSGMGKGPALALLLAGPALSLPNMLVIRSVLGTRRTLAFVVLVVVMAAVSGMIFGAIAG